MVLRRRSLRAQFDEYNDIIQYTNLVKLTRVAFLSFVSVRVHYATAMNASSSCCFRVVIEGAGLCTVETIPRRKHVAARFRVGNVVRLILFV